MTLEVLGFVQNEELPCGPAGLPCQLLPELLFHLEISERTRLLFGLCHFQHVNVLHSGHVTVPAATGWTGRVLWAKLPTAVQASDLRWFFLLIIAAWWGGLCRYGLMVLLKTCEVPDGSVLGVFQSFVGRSALRDATWEIEAIGHDPPLLVFEDNDVSYKGPAAWFLNTKPDYHTSPPGSSWRALCDAKA